MESDPPHRVTKRPASKVDPGKARSIRAAAAMGRRRLVSHLAELVADPTTDPTLLAEITELSQLSVDELTRRQLGRIRLAEQLVGEVATTDLTGLSIDQLDQLRARFDGIRDWLNGVYLHELSEQLDASVCASLDKVLGKIERRQHERRFLRRAYRNARLQRWIQARHQTGRVRPRAGRAPRRIVRVSRRQRLALSRSGSRSSDDDPEPAPPLGGSELLRSGLSRARERAA